MTSPISGSTSPSPSDSEMMEPKDEETSKASKDEAPEGMTEKFRRYINSGGWKGVAVGVGLLVAGLCVFTMVLKPGGGLLPMDIFASNANLMMLPPVILVAFALFGGGIYAIGHSIKKRCNSRELDHIFDVVKQLLFMAASAGMMVAGGLIFRHGLKFEQFGFGPFLLSIPLIGCGAINLLA